MEYDHLVKRKRANDNRERLNAGIIAAAIINMARDPDKSEPVSGLDFVPDWKHMAEAQRAGDLTKMTPEQQQAHMLSMFGKRNVKTKG